MPILRYQLKNNNQESVASSFEGKYEALTESLFPHDITYQAIERDDDNITLTSDRKEISELGCGRHWN